MAAMSRAKDQGDSWATISNHFRVWQNRQIPIKAGLVRCPTRVWETALSTLADMDKMIKGVAFGDYWNTLMNLALTIAKPSASKIAANAK